MGTFTIVLALSLSLLIGVSLGLLGGGGSILTVPIMIYALGVAEKSAIASSLVVVGTTSAVAAISHARSGNVVWRVALLFAGAGMAGAFLGGKVAKFLPSTLLLLLFAVIMFFTAAAMWRGRAKSVGTQTTNDRPLPLPKILLEGLVVGLVTGLVGAGGGFLVVPALALLGGLPMQKAVGSSLVVIALKSFAGFAGYASHVELNWMLTGIVTAAAVVGSFGGAALAKRVQQEQLRKGFAVFVFVMSLFLLGKQLQAFFAHRGDERTSGASVEAQMQEQPSSLPAPTATAAPNTTAEAPSTAIARGRALAEHTSVLAKDKVNAALACKSCHLAAAGFGPGTVAHAGHWVGIAARFPQHRDRSGKVDTLEDRINDCFERSMYGARLDDGDARMDDLVAYMASLTGTVALDERTAGMPKLARPRAADDVHGKAVYEARCIACHGAGGVGVVAAGVAVFPPLGGPQSFNIAAGMARLHTAAGFIHAHMPLGLGGTLSEDDAFDVAAYVTRLERPDFANKHLDWPKGNKPPDARY